MRLLFFIVFLVSFWNNSLLSQEIDTVSVEDTFLKQLSLYPQEKIHVQTDRSVYISGDTIWFRAHLVDALLLKQANASRYIYLELINPLDNLIQRVKIRPDASGCFYGHIQLDEELAEGNYTLRAYTRFMQNQGDDYFFHKSIYVTSPLASRLSPEIRFFTDNQEVRASFSFRKKNEAISPKQSSVCYDQEIEKNGIALTFEDNVGYFTFKEKAIKKNRTVLLQAAFDDGVYCRYLKLPNLDKDFDVSFFPEGGKAPYSTDVKIAFKSLNDRGLSEQIKGEVFDDLGQLHTTFETTHLGMGNFSMYYSPDRRYHAICTNSENVSKRFELPSATLDAVSLAALWMKNYLRVSLVKSSTHHFSADTYLIAHMRGAVLYTQPWNNEKDYILFDKDFFPAGIIHFLLIDKDKNILSERLVFSSQSSTFALADIAMNKEEYSTRDKVELTIQISDENKQPLSGNFSISVVDKKDVAIDTSSTIISTLLLSSELKGYIESPMSYLEKNNKRASQALDILMMTQGWRRYDIPNLIKGKLVYDLKYPVELSDEVSGKAEGLFSSLKGGNVSLVAYKDSVLGTSIVTSDEKGLFTFKDLEYPAGTQYIIQALTPKGSKNVFIEVNPIKSFPAFLGSNINHNRKTVIEEDFISKVNEKYTIEDGIRAYNLDEVVVTAKRNLKLNTESPYYSVSSSRVFTSADIEKMNPFSLFDLLRRIPGITISGEEVKYRSGTPMVILDNVPEEDFDYTRVDVSDVKDVFVSPPELVATIFGSRGVDGAVVINTKRGGGVEKKTLNRNLQIVVPVGYQQSVEFYSPAYATKTEKERTIHDFRTTIYWKPNVQFDNSGTAKVSFYTADYLTHYGVVIEGYSSDGHLVHSSNFEVPVSKREED